MKKPLYHTSTFTTDVELEDGSTVEVDAEYEFEPEERQTRHSPHFAAQVNVFKVTTPRGALDLPEAALELIADEILDHLQSEPEPDEDGVW